MSGFRPAADPTRRHSWPTAFDAIDHDELARRARRLQLEPELFLERSKDVLCSRNRRVGDRRQIRARCQNQPDPPFPIPAPEGIS